MGDKPLVFVSYSHHDRAWCELLRKQLQSVHGAVEYEVWIDDARIRAGDQWNPEIETALARADVALLLVSQDFLSSSVIKESELKPLLARRDAGLIVVPVLVGPCALDQIDWLHETEVRPRGKRPLDQVGNPDSPQVKALVAELVAELTRMVKERIGRLAPGDAAAGRVDPAALLRQVLLPQQDDAAAAALSRQIVDRLARLSGLSGDGLFSVVRLFIEFHLLRSPEPGAPRALLQSLDAAPGDKLARKLLNEIKRGAGNGDLSQCVIGVNAMFFMLACQREAQWQRYFDALQRAAAGTGAGGDVGTLCTVDVQYGFVAPQFLVAGLMARFDHDWRPILSSYARAIPDAAPDRRGFDSLQASQWNLWLMWGPSIPICRCEQWRGRIAFQYGYGDENNSLPLIEIEQDAQHAPRTLEPLLQRIVAEDCGAGAVKLRGRLRWGPQFLRGEDSGTAAEAAAVALQDVDPDDDDDPDQPPQLAAGRWRMADAQASLYCGSEAADGRHAEGLVLQLDRIDAASDEPRGYYSAYLWMMFLVAGPSTGDPIGPRLPWRRFYPPWPERPEQRAAVAQAGLWRNLLPVFAHANIADPAALRVQRAMLTQSAVAMLRGVWAQRDRWFDTDDLRAGTHFHLVCASDYTGCGDRLRYPSGGSLRTLMRQTLDEEPDRAFAEAVEIPATDDDGPARPEGLAGYYSSCHLPERVQEYFEHVARLQARAVRRA